MRVERNENQIAIHLTPEEVYAVQSGQIIGGRPGVTMPDAKIEVLPLSVVCQDDSARHRYALDRLKRAIAAPLKGNLFPNGDLQIIIPAVKLSDVRVSEAKLPREQIKTSLAEQDRELVNHIIPKGGIIIHFEGSLRVIDVDSYYPVSVE